MNILGLITARGGSKRVYKKNIRLVANKPLIAWTIEEALKSKLLSAVVVSTDDEEIAKTAKKYGAQVPFIRNNELATDTSAHIDCVYDALNKLNTLGYSPFDAVVLLQPTSPLRTVEDIDKLITLAIEKDSKAMVSVCESVEAPYFACTLNAENQIQHLLPQNIAYPRKQDLEQTYFINGAIYFNKIDSLKNEKTFYPPQCHAYILPVERSLQVDTEYELNVAHLLLSQRNPQ